MTEEKKRPTLADPEEFAIIKKIYFEPRPDFKDKEELEEEYDRMDHKHTENQAR